MFNELHVAPDPVHGDANGDGVVQTAADEFVELVNRSGEAQDISGWSVADRVRVRHEFPASTVISADCALVVFGGGFLLTELGGAGAQLASSGALGLNNDGDEVLLLDELGVVRAAVSYGRVNVADGSLTLEAGGTDGQYVAHARSMGGQGTLHSAGRQSNGLPFPGCRQAPAVAELWEIQGAGLASPFAFQNCHSRGNVVTAVGGQGFFLQTPEARSDQSVLTSDGIYVYTGQRPTLQVGETVDVEGLVVEFFGLTEFTSNPTVTPAAIQERLPSAVRFDAHRPSPDRSPGVVELERYEGMLVEFRDGTVTAPTDRFGEVTVVARAGRAFREPGLLHPGRPPLPVWDGNPEVFELSPTALGGLAVQFAAGQRISHCRGVLTYHFGAYQLRPTLLVRRGEITGRPVREALNDEITAATQNLFRLFDDRDDPLTLDAVPSSETYHRRLGKVARAIGELLRGPDILAVQEVESLDVLEALAARVETIFPDLIYTAVLIEGFDPAGIDVGFLVRDRVRVLRSYPIGLEERFSFAGVDQLTFPRPPLVLEAEVTMEQGEVSLTLINVHLKSLREIDSDERVRVHRHSQTLFLARFVQRFQQQDPSATLAVLGDFNAFQFSDGYVDVVGGISGTSQPSDALLAVTERVDPPLHNPLFRLPATERYSFVFRGNAQVLDHVLLSQNAVDRIRDITFARGHADVPTGFAREPNTALRASDHDGLVLYLGVEDGRDGERFVRGDVDADGQLNPGDVIFLLRHLFAGAEEPPCADAADVNADGRLNLADATRLIVHLFGASVPLAPPYPDCGPALGNCERYGACSP